MADDEVELTDEQLREQELQQQFDQRVPPLKSLDDYNAHVRDDVENLVCLVAVSSQCPHSRSIRDPLMKLANPRATIKNSKFYRFDVHEAPEIAQQLQVAQVPAFYLTLKGVNWDTLVGSNMERAAGTFRNSLIKRNEVMREYDLAKLPKKPEEDEEGEEGEEEAGEEDDE